MTKKNILQNRYNRFNVLRERVVTKLTTFFIISLIKSPYYSVVIRFDLSDT